MGGCEGLVVVGCFLIYVYARVWIWHDEWQYY
jgi:hypothetical protein